MKVRGIRLLPYALPLCEVLETAHGPIRERRGWLVEFESEAGLRGWGDAAPLPGFGMESEAQCVKALLALGADWLAADASKQALPRALASMKGGGAVAETPAACFALETGFRDLLARHENSPFRSRLAREVANGAPGGGIAVREDGAAGVEDGGVGDHANSRVAVSGLVSGAGIPALCESARGLARRGFESFKLKLGARDWREDLARVRALRGAVGPDARLRVDANGAWSRGRAAAMLLALSELRIEFIEQPVAAEDLEGLAQLRAAGEVAIAADEAASDRAGALAVIESRAADLLILKPAALGGLGGAAEIAGLAARAGIPVVLTSLLDSVFGTLAVAQLAAALPGERPADGLATGALFEFDLAPQPRIRDGQLELPSGPGLGIVPDPARLARARAGDPIEIEP
jgi:o-succinylbenzoate synthase